MNRPEDEPVQQEIESLASEEERRTLLDPSVPDDVKSEIAERLARFREADLEQRQAEDAGNSP